MVTLRFTPTEKRILAVLSDGKAHRTDSLMRCLSDDLTSKKTLITTICKLREKLNYRGESVVCEVRYRKWYYRWVKLIDPKYLTEDFQIRQSTQPQP